MAALIAYFDESGVHDNKTTVTVAGMVGTEQNWRKLENQWSALLRKSGLGQKEAFHATALEGGRDPFHRLDVIRRGALYSQFVSLIMQCSLTPISSGVLCDHFMRFTEAERSRMSHGKPDVPYFQCLQDFWIESAHCADSLPDGEQIFYISDNLDGGFKTIAEESFNAYKNDKSWSNSKRLDDIIFRPKEEFPGLQAADLLAYESRTDFENRFHYQYVYEKWGQRSAITLLRRKFGKRAKYYDEPTMRKLLDLIP